MVPPRSSAPGAPLPLLAAGILFLASEAASFITGTELLIDGGASLMGRVSPDFPRERARRRRGHLTADACVSHVAPAAAGSIVVRDCSDLIRP